MAESARLEIEFPDTIGNLSSNLSLSAIAEGFAALRGPLFLCPEWRILTARRQSGTIIFEKGLKVLIFGKKIIEIAFKNLRSSEN